MAANNAYTFPGLHQPTSSPSQEDGNNTYKMSLKEQDEELAYENIGFERTREARPAEDLSTSPPATKLNAPNGKLHLTTKIIVIMCTLLVLSLTIGVTCMALIFGEKANTQSTIAEQMRLIATKQRDFERALNASEIRKKEMLTKEIDKVKAIQASSDEAQNIAIAEQMRLIATKQRDFERALNASEIRKKKMLTKEIDKVKAIQASSDEAQNIAIAEAIARMNKTDQLARDIGILNSSIANNTKNIDLLIIRSALSVRLGGTGATISRGRVEIFHGGEWGTICDDSWDLNDAYVICRMLGFSRATEAPHRASYGQGSGQIWLDNVQCSGSESRIEACPKNSWGVHNCGHNEDASVVCE